jgi:Icc protein
MSQSSVKIIQITDCHLGEAHGDELLSMNPDESLCDVLSLVNTDHPKADFLVATGDLANDPSIPAYQRLHHTLSSSIDYPFAWLPGNHDDPAMMQAVGEFVNVKVHIVGAWLIVLLNSRVEGHIYGQLSHEELAFLETTLQAHQDKHVMVCLHHQLVPIGSQWMDNYIVRNSSDVWSLIDQYDHVKIILWGHVHQEFSDTYNNVALLATPSTCIQFTPGQKDFHVENAMPGYRWLELHSDGSFDSGVERVTEKNYGTDVHSHGY